MNKKDGRFLGFSFLIIIIFLVYLANNYTQRLASAPESSMATPITQSTVVKSFLSHSYPNIGEFMWVTDMPDWANGTRQKITTTKGTYLFYFQNNEVVGVRQYNAEGAPIIEIYRKN